MKSRIPYALAAVLASAGISLALAQKDQDVRSVDAPPINFVQEPIASATRQGAQDPLVTSIVKALNADAALQHSKISVQPDEGTVVLSGVTLTQAQKQQAVRIASSQAGAGKVVDALQSDDV